MLVLDKAVTVEIYPVGLLESGRGGNVIDSGGARKVGERRQGETWEG